MIQNIQRLLNDSVLGLLALLSFFLLIAPAVFTLSPAGTFRLAAVEHFIILLFAVEYFSGLALASDKRQFLRNKWRLLDALIIVTALIPLIPAAPEFLRNSPALRLVRLGRVALLGTKSGIALTSPRESPETVISSEQAHLRVLALDQSGLTFEEIDWDESISRILGAEPDWLFISGVTQEHLAPIAQALRVPEQTMDGLFKSNVPRFGRLERFSTLFVRYPLPMSPGEKLRRTPVLLVGSDDNVVVLSRETTELSTHVQQRLAALDNDMPRMVRATIALLGEIVRANTQIVENLEATLLGIEADQVTLKDKAFLARTFDLRTDILRVRSSLQHIRNVLRGLARGNLTLGALDESDRALFRMLEEDASDLFESSEDLRDSLQALVDLRLNVSSFQMNQVMRLLAVLTAVALIPATAGGLLGMNLADTPWPGTLAQVSFGVAAGMSLSLYIFIIKGWLR